MSEPDIKTYAHYPDEWSAIDDRTYDGLGSMIGWGRTEQDAIDDLLCQIADSKLD